MEEVCLQEIGSLLGTVLPSIPIKGFAVDSRLVKPGFVFFALQGAKVDGHDFIEEAFSKGAICAVVSSSYAKKNSNQLIHVPDPLKALHHIAKKKFEEKKMRCVAVTGSVGKTTTKEFIATLLEEDFPLRKTEGNANSQTGFPLSILHEKKGGEIFIAEMGMSAPQEIASLTQIAPPDFAVMTKVALAHAMFFPGGLEDIAEAKAEILSHPNTKKAWVHRQAFRFTAFQNQRTFPIVTYDLAQDGIAFDGFSLRKKGGGFAIEEKGRQISPDFTLPFAATHLLENFLVSALVAYECGMSWDRIFTRAQYLKAYEKRFEIMEKNGVVYVNDSYNANPESVKAALSNLPVPKPGKKRIAVLGEMRELGPFSYQAHQEIGYIASSSVDLLLCLAGNAVVMAETFVKMGKKAEFFEDLQDVRKALHREVEKGDVVLVKASKSLKMWEVLEDVD